MMYVIYGVIVSAILLGWIINMFDKRKPKMSFVAVEMPHMKPLPMGTSGVGFWKGIKMWLTTSRKWELTDDWVYTINGTRFKVPKGFVFDGASVPKFFSLLVKSNGRVAYGRIGT